MMKTLEAQIFKIKSKKDFKQTALDVFKYQYKANSVYRKFCQHFISHPSQVNQLHDIPFLPIELFKTHSINSQASFEKVFLSSGTTGQKQSEHYVYSLELYQKSYLSSFNYFYGNPEDYIILALLPSYLEREGSSLIYMVNDFIHRSKHPESGFYLDNLDELAATLTTLQKSSKKILLIGVSFALLDLAEAYDLDLSHCTIMETGGMKGRRKEMIRAELHQTLKNAFKVSNIHSEYGMTELLSQAYSIGKGVFKCPLQLDFLIRDSEDPLSYLPIGKTGGINVIDLANLYSCSFIATKDLGKQQSQDEFEILGRFDHSDIRGCNLMAV